MDAHRALARASMPGIKANANTIASALLFCAAVVCDASTALDPSEGTVDAAASLRTSSIAAILCLASPSFITLNPHDTSATVAQRVVLLAILLAISFNGRHYGGVETRAADAWYVALVGVGIIMVNDAGGIEPEGTTEARSDKILHRGRAVTSLAAALLAYVCFRGCVASFQCASEPSRHVVPETGEVAYALYSPWQSWPLAFGYSVGAVAAISILLSSDVELRGAGAVHIEASTCGVLMLTAACIAQIGGTDQIDGLTVLYGPSSCSSSSKSCSTANASRRFSAVIASPSSLWTAGLGLLVFGFAFEMRPKRPVRAAAISNVKNERRMLSVTAAVSVLASTASILGFEEAFNSWRFCLFALAIVGILFAAQCGEHTPLGFLGSCVYVGSSIAFQVFFVRTYSFDATVVHITHWTLAFSSFAMTLQLLLLCVNECLTNRATFFFDKTSAFLTSAGVSSALMLFLAAAVLTSTTSGQIPHEYISSGSGGETMVAFVFEHYLPIVAWIPALSCRPECHQEKIAAWTAWLCPIVIIGVSYALFTSWARLESPAFAAIEGGTASASTCVCVVAWFMVGRPQAMPTRLEPDRKHAGEFNECGECDECE